MAYFFIWLFLTISMNQKRYELTDIAIVTINNILTTICSLILPTETMIGSFLIDRTKRYNYLLHLSIHVQIPQILLTITLSRDSFSPLKIMYQSLAFHLKTVLPQHLLITQIMLNLFLN